MEIRKMSKSKICKQNKCCKKKVSHKVENNKSTSKLNNDTSMEEFYSSPGDDHIPLDQMFCYEPVEKCAEKITDMNIILAKSFVSGAQPFEFPEYKNIKYEKSVWPVKGELNMTSGFGALENYIQSLKVDPTLKYCINFVSQMVDKISTTFFYEVKFSMPTAEAPVQLSTANVYFKLRAYFTYPPQCPIDVEYSYEYSSLVYKPGEGKFRENWLLSIIECKREFRDKNNLKMEIFL